MRNNIATLILFAVLLTTTPWQMTVGAVQTAPTIAAVSGKVAVGQRSNLRIEGSNFDPGSVEVVVFGGKCTTGCVVPNDVLAEDDGSITTTVLSAVPVTINHPGTFEVAVRNGPQGRLSNRKTFTAQ